MSQRQGNSSTAPVRRPTHRGLGSWRHSASSSTDNSRQDSQRQSPSYESLMDELKSLSLASPGDINPGVVNRSRSILFKCSGLPEMRIGILVNCECLDGSRAIVTVHGFGETQIEADLIFSPGRVFALMEPYFTRSVDGTRSYVVRNPHEVVLMDEFDPFVLRNAPEWAPEHLVPKKVISAAPRAPAAPTVAVAPTGGEHLRLDGNAKLRLGQFDAALAAYQEAASVDSSDVAAVANQAEVYLRIGEWDLAFRAAQAALEIDPNHSKSAFRKARALAAKEDYVAARDVLRQPPLKDSEEAKELAVKCGRRIKQAEGEFMWDSLTAPAMSSLATRLGDVADFTGPIKLVPVPGKGMGVVATSTIRKGQLLCVSKSIAVAFATEFPEYHEGGRGVPVFEHELRDPTSRIVTALTDQIMKKLPTNRTLAREIKELSRGRFSEKGNKHISDTELVREIVASNSLGFMASLRLGLNPCIDLGTNYAGAGVWLLPSRFNHSCQPNCSFRVFGDLMVVVANRTIANGEELFFSYVSPFYRPIKLDTNKCEPWGFQCDCARCLSLSRPGPFWRDISDDDLLPESGAELDPFFAIIAEALQALPKQYAVDAVVTVNRIADLVRFNEDPVGTLKCYTRIMGYLESNPWVTSMYPELNMQLCFDIAECHTSPQKQREWIDKAGRNLTQHGPIFNFILTRMMHLRTEDLPGGGFRLRRRI